MAQLVKLYDYISRYETNPFHYPSRFIQLKQDNWQHFFDRANLTSYETNLTDVELDARKKQLIQRFLNQLLPFQYKWATSTLTHKSYTDKKYIHDDILTFFIQRFPDIYLVMYYPLFSVQKAPIDGEIILISPIGIEIIHVVQEVQDARVIINEQRTWQVESNHDVVSIVSPLITLKRTEQIVASILKLYDINLPIQKTVLSETNDFMYLTLPYRTNIVGKQEYKEWFTQKRALQSPLKNVQLRAMEALLKHCHSTYVRRPEWESDDDDSYMTVGSIGE